MVKRHKSKREPDVLEKYVLPGLILVFFVSIAVFWNSLSWIANGEVWNQILSDALPQYFHRPYVMADKKPVIEPLGGPNATSTTTTEVKPKPENASTSPDVVAKPRKDTITIPKLGVVAPIVTAKTTDSAVIHGLLDSGVVLYPGSMPFGQAGQTVLLGHSAPTGWPKIKYDWVFSKVNLLEEGDMVVISYDNETRYYQMVKTRVVTPQEGVPEPTVEGNSLALVSCWPPGKDLKRIIVETTIVDE
jgi:LPXTG-site transpeptidase (sortase) family protein